MFFPEEDLGNVVHFHWEPLAQKFGSFFMTSTVAWMMAQAILERVDEIGIWGIEAEFGTEYRQQRTGIKHFIEVARLLKIKVNLVTISGLAANPTPYPFWLDDPYSRRVLYEIDRRENEIPELDRKIADLQKRRSEVDGELEILNWSQDFRHS
jgi:hypothetical protein